MKEYNFDDTGVFIGAHIVDDQAWEKVKKQVYKGFSVGGKKLPDGYDKVTKTITGMKLTEISLVDRPANPEALIEMYKADGLPDAEPEQIGETQMTIDAETLAKAVSDFLATEQGIEMIRKAATPVTTPEVAPEATPDVTPEVVAPVIEKSALQKSFAALAVTDAGDVEKGMYCIADLAQLINSLKWLQSDTAYEAQNEGDASPVPGKLGAIVAQLGDVLVEMATEEVAELVASLKDSAGNSIATLSAMIENSAQAGDLKKAQELFDIAKAGKRNSATDQADLQKAHDILKGLGADCGTNDGVSDAMKHDHANDIAKSEHVADIEKMAGEMGTLRKSLETLSAEHATLKKMYDDLPQPSKGVLKVVAKGDDATPMGTPVEQVAPVLKQDGTVDEVATEIKKVLAGGGRRLF